MTRLRVLHVVESLGRGGAEVLLAQALPLLGAAGVEVKLIALAQPDTLQAEIVRSGVPTRTLLDRSSPSKADLLHATWLLRSELARAPVDIIHTHLFHASIAARLAAKAVADRPRIVTTLHNPDYRGLELENFSRGKVLTHQLAEWASIVTSNAALLAVSSAVAADYVRVLGRRGALGEIRVLHNAIDVKAQVHESDAVSRSVARERWKLAPDAFVVTSVGRLAYQKNFSLLIEAISALRARGVDAHALVVGDGPELAMLQAATSPFVKFVGSYAREGVISAIAACDVYAQPSRYEAFGIAIVEAMAAARPIVATDVDGIPEVVDAESAILFRSESVGAFTDALAALARDPGRRERMGIAGRSRAISRFDLSRWVADTKAIYEHVLAS